MKILYDYQALFMQKYGGVSRYFYEIIDKIRKGNPEDELNVKAAISINYYFRNEIKQRDSRLKHGNDFFNNMGIYAAIKMANLKNSPYDIIHPTFYYDGYLYKYPDMLSKSKVVVTIHDMIHERFGLDQATIDAKKESMTRADAIIAVSEYTKQDILDIYPELSTKPIKVIYHGSSIMDKNNVKSISLPDRYILFVGQRAGYKNFNVLLKALALIKNSKNEDIKLVVSGGGDFSREEDLLIRSCEIEDRILKYNLTDSELAYAYRNALAFVYPSKYEGFGIPILEAYGQRCPVILSNASCFPEVAGDAAYYFEPDDVEGLANAIEEICQNEAIRKNLMEKGLIRLKKYSWDVAARETRDFYCKVVGA